MFIDEAEIQVSSGKGGDGMVHFHREKYVARGGPDGGDGGKGGDIILQASRSINSLAKFQHKSQFIADSGKNGAVSNQTGRSADDLVIIVPLGTLVFDAKSNELLADLIHDQQRVTLCKGGRGGRGNTHFTSARRQAPRIAEKGEPGESKSLRLELKLIADVGLVGKPNAGKSSLLAAVTRARPKIADYPFTTIVPNLGIANLDDDHLLILADIPGLLEGAAEGYGLGVTFLKHIQRTRLLIHMLDGASPDPIADYDQINKELAAFDEKLAAKPQIVALNKIDMREAGEVFTLVKRALGERGVEVFPISAMTREGLQPLLWKAYEILQALPEEPEPEDALPVYKPEAPDNDFTIKRTGYGWRVEGKAIERAAEMTFWEHEPSIRRFYRYFVSLGIDKALREAGVQEGDTVEIGEFELEWQD